MSTTFYVSIGGDDDTSDGSDQSTPFRTIKKAIERAQTAGDVVEILDQGTYAESNHIDVKNDNITLTHTASELGRPIIDYSGLGSNELFDLTQASSHAHEGFTLNGLEIKGNGTHALLETPSGNNNANGLTITDCFMYNLPKLQTFALNIESGHTAKILTSSFMFTPNNSRAIEIGTVAGSFLIENCFLSRSSNGGGGESIQSILRADDRTCQATASFCTFIFNDVERQVNVIENFPKVINCVVSSTIGTAVSGIDAVDHTFNVVNCGGGDFGFAFKNGSNASASAGTGDIVSAFTFINPESRGNTENVVADFGLDTGSVGIDQGTAFNNVSVDILGVSRPQNGSFDIGAFEFTTGGGGGGGGGTDEDFTTSNGAETFNLKFGSNSFVIHGTANKLITRRFNSDKDNRQAPYFITIPGPPTIRERNTSYKNET